MTKPRPEVVLGDPRNWIHFDNLPDISSPSANPNSRSTNALHGDKPLEQTAQAIASIGAIWNSRKPEAMAKRQQIKPEFIYTAQEMRNRQLAKQLGYELPMRHDPTGLAIHHATGKAQSIWHDIAELTQNPEQLESYCNTLEKYAPKIHEQTSWVIRHLTAQLQQEPDTYNLKKNREGQRKTDQKIKEIAHTLSELDQNYQNGAKAQAITNERAKKQTKKTIKAQNTKPHENKNSTIWANLVPKIHKLEMNHKGAQTPKRIASNIGKNPSRIANYYSDPNRRVFTRKTKNTGALVIVDTSGSMHFEPYHLDQIMQASKGATVVTYSETGNHENCHLIASNGKRVKELPPLGGNNGVDVPAINWALKNFRRNKRQQIILISDGKATGRNNGTNAKCRDELRQTISKHKIHIEKDINEAIRKLKTLKTSKLPTNPKAVPK